MIGVGGVEGGVGMRLGLGGRKLAVMIGIGIGKHLGDATGDARIVAPHLGEGVALVLRDEAVMIGVELVEHHLHALLGFLLGLGRRHIASALRVLREYRSHD